MPIGIVDEWSNILHVGLGGNSGQYGDRTPAIFFWPGSTKIAIHSAINGNKEYPMDPDPIPINQWTRVDMSQLCRSDGVYQFTLQIAGTIVHQITNTDAREFLDVKVYTGDNFYPAANAKIANLTIETFPDNINTVLTPTLLPATSSTTSYSTTTVQSTYNTQTSKTSTTTITSTTQNLMTTTSMTTPLTTGDSLNIIYTSYGI